MSLLLLYLFLALALGIALGYLYARMQLGQQIATLRAQLQAERERGESQRKHADEQWRAQLRLVQEQLQTATAQQLQERQASLHTSNRQQLELLLAPLKEEFARFQREMAESKQQGMANKQELQSSFEQAMRLFQQQQEQAVRQLREQTERIGSDAAHLAQALRGESKTQGDWGEMILATMLENCGLRRDEEYFVQQEVKDKEGKRFRPDVVVRFPEGRSVVIDSKVSLTAYAAATAATDESERNRLLREHVQSMRRHVDELAAKDYAALVEGTIGFVLLFVPNENSYIAAMKADPSLSQYAYQKQIIIISPSNLLMALKLAYHLWQADRQTRNVEQIVKKAGDLYDKVASFATTFAEVEKYLNKAHEAFSKAHTQLYNGQGNVMRRLEQLRDMGITPKKQIRRSEPSDE
ncbi:MAG: DNA recombination protein RmuC [Bacteroidales bacterium]|nr:DNA recombination protein RmuC [Bacteroidales bacterium]